MFVFNCKRCGFAIRFMWIDNLSGKLCTLEIPEGVARAMRDGWISSGNWEVELHPDKHDTGAVEFTMTGPEGEVTGTVYPGEFGVTVYDSNVPEWACQSFDNLFKYIKP